MENKPKCIIDIDGTKIWFLNGQFHREDGPAVELTDGTKKWYINGKFHREHGPAVELTDGTKKWYINGKLHRLDGPAVIYDNGSHTWFINNFHITDKISQWAKENDIDLDNLSEVDKALIKIVWSGYKIT